MRLFELYNSLCPPDRPDNAFYLRPLGKYSINCWFSNVVVGINTLGSVVAKLCSSAGFVGYFTNHSLRATAATRLFAANVDEQLIKLKTGHSSDAVRSYKRVNEKQLSNMTDVICNKMSKRNETESEKNNCSVAVPKQFAESSAISDTLSSVLFEQCAVNGTININVFK